jgi:hypothetical protein
MLSWWIRTTFKRTFISKATITFEKQFDVLTATKFTDTIGDATHFKSP